MDDHVMLDYEDMQYIAGNIKGLREVTPDSLKLVIHDKDILLKLSESNDQFAVEKSQIINDKTTTYRQRNLRESIAEKIQNLGIPINYRTMTLSALDLRKGLQAKIAKDSRFTRKNDDIGTLLEDFHEENGELHAFVQFPDGYKNLYRSVDLEPVINNEYLAVNKEYNIKNGNSSFDDFRIYLKDSIMHVLASNPLLLVINENRGEFKRGESVILRPEGKNSLILSTEASQAKILTNLGFGNYKVEFVKPFRNGHKGIDYLQTYQLLRKENFSDLIAKAGGLENYAQELVESSINRTVAKLVEGKFRKYNLEKLTELLLESKLLIRQGDKMFVNENQMLQFTAPKLSMAYEDKNLYSSKDMFSPPSERKPHVLRLELTPGCDYRRCTYCEGFKGIQFSEKSYSEFMKHYKDVVDAIGDHIFDIKRVFIGGGNALGADYKTLKKAVNKLRRDLHPQRISVYGRADAIVSLGTSKLKKLRHSGLNLIYWGIESGSNEVLSYVNKGVTQEDMFKALEIVYESRIPLSVMVMPGLGGIKYYDSHIKETASILNYVPIKFITFMAINAGPSTLYHTRMQKELSEGTNRPLTDKETVQQIKGIINSMKPYGQKIGMFDCGIDQVGNNPLMFNVNFHDSGKSQVIDACDRYLFWH